MTGSGCMTDGGDGDGVAASGNGRWTWKVISAKASAVFPCRCVCGQLERMSLFPFDVDGGHRSSCAGGSESESELGDMNSSNLRGHLDLDCCGHGHRVRADECRPGLPDACARLRVSGALPRLPSPCRPFLVSAPASLRPRLPLGCRGCLFARRVAGSRAACRMRARLCRGSLGAEFGAFLCRGLDRRQKCCR